MNKLIARLVFAGVTILLVGELGARFMGVISFPLYDIDPEMGYILRANQEGRFLRKNYWKIGREHLYGGDFDSSKRPAVLLLGDSLVWGGNPFRHEERLGVRLEHESGKVVWSSAAGSWSSWSELAYLARYPEVASASDTIVIVFNSADFDRPTMWPGERTHPTRYPISALWYSMQKIFHASAPSELKDSLEPELNKEQIRTSILKLTDLVTRGKRVIVVLWPNRRERELGSSKLSLISHSFEDAKKTGLIFVDMSRDPRLTIDLYRDEIHPTQSKGTELLARVIRDSL